MTDDPRLLPTDQMTCPKCKGTGHVKATRAVEPWGTFQQRCDLAQQVKPGDRWVQIKSGRVAIVGEPNPRYHDCVALTHENGMRTHKWRSYFASEFTPESPPND